MITRTLTTSLTLLLIVIGTALPVQARILDIDWLYAKDFANDIHGFYHGAADIPDEIDNDPRPWGPSQVIAVYYSGRRFGTDWTYQGQGQIVRDTWYFAKDGRLEGPFIGPANPDNDPRGPWGPTKIAYTYFSNSIPSDLLPSPRPITSWEYGVTGETSSRDTIAEATPDTNSSSTSTTESSSNSTTTSSTTGATGGPIGYIPTVIPVAVPEEQPSEPEPAQADTEQTRVTTENEAPSFIDSIVAVTRDAANAVISRVEEVFTPQEPVTTIADQSTATATIIEEQPASTTPTDAALLTERERPVQQAITSEEQPADTTTATTAERTVRPTETTTETTQTVTERPTATTTTTEQSTETVPLTAPFTATITDTTTLPFISTVIPDAYVAEVPITRTTVTSEEQPADTTTTTTAERTVRPTETTTETTPTVTERPTTTTTTTEQSTETVPLTAPFTATITDTTTLPFISTVIPDAYVAEVPVTRTTVTSEEQPADTTTATTAERTVRPTETTTETTPTVTERPTTTTTTTTTTTEQSTETVPLTAPFTATITDTTTLPFISTVIPDAYVAEVPVTRTTVTSEEQPADTTTATTAERTVRPTETTDESAPALLGEITISAPPLQMLAPVDTTITTTPADRDVAVATERPERTTVTSEEQPADTTTTTTAERTVQPTETTAESAPTLLGEITISAPPLQMLAPVDTTITTTPADRDVAVATERPERTTVTSEEQPADTTTTTTVERTVRPTETTTETTPTVTERPTATTTTTEQSTETVPLTAPFTATITDTTTLPFISTVIPDAYVAEVPVTRTTVTSEERPADTTTTTTVERTVRPTETTTETTPTVISERERLAQQLISIDRIQSDDSRTAITPDCYMRARRICWIDTQEQTTIPFEERTEATLREEVRQDESVPIAENDAFVQNTYSILSPDTLLTETVSPIDSSSASTNRLRLAACIRRVAAICAEPIRQASELVTCDTPGFAIRYPERCPVRIAETTNEERPTERSTILDCRDAEFAADNPLRCPPAPTSIPTTDRGAIITEREDTTTPARDTDVITARRPNEVPITSPETRSIVPDPRATTIATPEPRATPTQKQPEVADVGVCNIPLASTIFNIPGIIKVIHPMKQVNSVAVVKRDSLHQFVVLSGKSEFAVIDPTSADLTAVLCQDSKSESPVPFGEAENGATKFMALPSGEVFFNPGEFLQKWIQAAGKPFAQQADSALCKTDTLMVEYGAITAKLPLPDPTDPTQKPIIGRYYVDPDQHLYATIVDGNSPNYALLGLATWEIHSVDQPIKLIFKSMPKDLLDGKDGGQIITASKNGDAISADLLRIANSGKSLLYHCDLFADSEMTCKPEIPDDMAVVESNKKVFGKVFSETAKKKVKKESFGEKLANKVVDDKVDSNTSIEFHRFEKFATIPNAIMVSENGSWALRESANSDISKIDSELLPCANLAASVDMDNFGGKDILFIRNTDNGIVTYATPNINESPELNDIKLSDGIVLKPSTLTEENEVLSYKWTLKQDGIDRSEWFQDRYARDAVINWPSDFAGGETMASAMKPSLTKSSGAANQSKEFEASLVTTDPGGESAAGMVTITKSLNGQAVAGDFKATAPPSNDNGLLTVKNGTDSSSEVVNGASGENPEDKISPVDQNFVQSLGSAMMGGCSLIR